MNGIAVVTMILILGFVWGGLAFIIGTAARKEGAKRVADTGDGP